MNAEFSSEIPMSIFENLSTLSGAPLTFCSTTYGVSFPMTEKLEVNGPERHPLYRTLTATADETGQAGDVQWNFEKFLVSADGRPVARFRPMVEPGSQELTDAIESELPSLWAPDP